MVSKINDYLYVIKVSLPDSPLRNLNSYVITSPERNLLVDTGFNRPECQKALQDGIEELGLDMNKTDILATHFHSDHIGLAAEIVSPGCKIYIGEFDSDMLSKQNEEIDFWQFYGRQYTEEGVPPEITHGALEKNPARKYAPTQMVEYSPLKEGDVLHFGDVAFQCIHTPGHTPGHICLYNETDKIMILGDHVLFDISPNITTWAALPNSLKHYLDSLKKIQAYDVVTPLPGHRECHISMDQRIKELFAHHKERLEETYQVVANQPGIHGYGVAGKMRWSIRAKNWADFPLAQKWFAIGETLSHLYYLVEEGRLVRKMENGQTSYFICE